MSAQPSGSKVNIMNIKSLSVVAAALVASTAAAQTPAVSPGWAAYAGCWAPVPINGTSSASSSAKVCVVPNGNAAELVSITGETITDRTRIEADGFHHDVTRQGCAGWESAAFSSDGKR